MRNRRLMIAAVGVLVLAVAALVAVPEWPATLMAHLAEPSYGHLLVANVLAGLRADLTALEKRAKDKLAEIKEGLAEADVRRIEGEHAGILTEIEAKKRAIVEAETAERTAPPPAPATPTAQQAADTAVAAERTRVSTIRDIGQRAGMPAADVEAAISGGTAVDAFRVRAFDTLAERSRATPTASVQGSIGRDENDTRRNGMRDAIVARLARAAWRPGETRVEIPEHARQWGEMGFAELAAEAIGWRGHLRTARQVDEVFRRAFHSTSDFPAIFGDALNQRLLARYMQAAPTYRLFCAPYLATDFRTINVVRAGDFPSLQRVQETGEIKAGTFTESKEQLAVHPYGIRFGISRQMIVNDNLGAIDQVLGSAGDGVLNWENALAFELLVSNSFTGPTLLTDATVMFHTNHGNETASGTAISITSVGAGRAQMMKQTSLDGRKLNLQPVTLLTGPDRLTEAEQLVATINPALIANAQTDWMKRLRPAGDANVTGDHWWLFADPMVAPCFVYGNLQGYEGPRLSTNDPFTVQGIEVKLEHDFGVAGTDFRGATHNEGAPPA